MRLVLETVIVLGLVSSIACGGDDDTAACPAGRNCAGITCGIDPVCGMLCDYCPTGQTCNSTASRCEGGTPTCTEALCSAGSTECCSSAAPGTWNTSLRRCVCGGGSCGDGTCDSGEDCASCAGDCGACPGYCGDGFCEPARGEDCIGCERDCGVCPYCGDGTCDPDETCSTCNTDCGVCPCTSALCTAGSTLCCPSGNPGMWNSSVAHCDCFDCTTPEDCNVVDICLGGRCESAWGRAYRITVVNGIYPSHCVSDPDGSEPDPYVELTINSTTYTTLSAAPQNDTVTPTWNVHVDTTLLSTSTLGFTIFDDDVTTDDTIASHAAGPIDATWLHDGAVTFHSDDWTYTTTFTFAPL